MNMGSAVCIDKNVALHMPWDLTGMHNLKCCLRIFPRGNPAEGRREETSARRGNSSD